MALKKVRILLAGEIDGAFYRVNQVVNIEAAIVKPFVKDGVADDSKAAVEYCLNELDAIVVTHDSKTFDAKASAKAEAEEAKRLEEVRLAEIAAADAAALEAAEKDAADVAPDSKDLLV